MHERGKPALGFCVNCVSSGLLALQRRMELQETRLMLTLLLRSKRRHCKSKRFVFLKVFLADAFGLVNDPPCDFAGYSARNSAGISSCCA